MISLDKQVIETTFPVVCSAEVAGEGVALGTSLGESWCGDERGKGRAERGAGSRTTCDFLYQLK